MPIFGHLRNAIRNAESAGWKANKVADMAEALVKDLQDGFGVDAELEVDVEEDVGPILMGILSGKGGRFPVKLKITATIDPKVDA